MNYYFAPLEGINGYIYRNAYHRNFHHMDKYFTPFIAPNQNRCMNTKETNDILPEHNEGMYVVPQILTNKAADFIRTEKELRTYGYQEINLNLGCPSGTVVSKKKGAGFLEYPDLLEAFLDEIFSNCECAISLKTRLGRYEPEEFNRLLKIYNKFPLKELIIHPRIQQDFYKGTPRMETFKEAVAKSTNPLCYNGDLFSKEDLDSFSSQFQQVPAVMLGRGLLANPGLINLAVDHQIPAKEQYIHFYEEVFLGYQDYLSGDRNLLYKMKEFWSYFKYSFSNYENYGKKLLKANKISDYENIVRTIFEEEEIVSDGCFGENKRI